MQSVLAVDNDLQHLSKVEIDFFSAESCGHCRQEKIFLQELKKEYGEKIAIKEFEIGEKNNLELLKKAKNKLGVKNNGVPFTLIGDEYFVGFGSAETTGKLFKKAIEKELGLGAETIADKKISLPIIGEVDVRNFSLFGLTVIIAGLDGFNPCAMWALVFLISLLLGMKNRLRMWILGSTFIVVSAVVYFLFMTAWLNLFLFLGFIWWVRIAIAVVALFSGGYYLRDYVVNKDGVCNVSSGGKKTKFFEKLRTIIHKKQFWLALFGVMVMAFAVNLIELICSAGLPAVFTQVLAMSNLNSWQHYAYLLLYIFIFMLDDLIVFFLAMITLRAVSATGKYSRYSRLLGGVIMIIIGLFLIFRPEWLK